LVDQAELIHIKTSSDKVEERIEAVGQISYTFAILPDKDAAFNDLIRLTDDEDWIVRFRAVEALGAVFPHVPDKNVAWQVLHQLTGDKDSFVGLLAARALCDVFPTVPDKNAAYQILYRLAGNEDSSVRWRAACALGAVFSQVPKKNAAWQILDLLTDDDEGFVRSWAASAIGAAFPHVPDRNAAWAAMVNLSKDPERDVRVSANHSLGRASIFKATETKREEDFRRVLENALEYFEKSAAEARYSNPAEFCLPFYRSFHIIAFKNTYAVTELNEFLNEAKNIAKGSKNREKLLEIIEHISQAQKEAQAAQEMDVDAMKCYLNIYRKHCEPASDLLRSTEESAPIATALIRKRTPIIDQDIRETIKTVLEAVEAKRVPESELKETLDAMQQTLLEIEQQNVDLQETLKRDVERSRKVINDHELEVADKLKLTIPIIPHILSYERVIGLKSGMNLSAAWQALVNRARRRK